VCVRDAAIVYGSRGELRHAAEGAIVRASAP
jgi:hypothetical protein